MTSPFCGAWMGRLTCSRSSLAKSVPGTSFQVPPGPTTRTPGSLATNSTLPLWGARMTIFS
ncbi:hypothetical protein DSECCO2_399470 [anaerobic digester metagenome]